MLAAWRGVAWRNVARYAELQLWTPCKEGVANEMFKLEADGTLRSAFNGYCTAHVPLLVPVRFWVSVSVSVSVGLGQTNPVCLPLTRRRCYLLVYLRVTRFCAVYRYGAVYRCGTL